MRQVTLHDPENKAQSRQSVGPGSPGARRQFSTGKVMGQMKKMLDLLPKASIIKFRVLNKLN